MRLWSGLGLLTMAYSAACVFSLQFLPRNKSAMPSGCLSTPQHSKSPGRSVYTMAWNSVGESNLRFADGRTLGLLAMVPHGGYPQHIRCNILIIESASSCGGSLVKTACPKNIGICWVNTWAYPNLPDYFSASVKR